MMIDLRTHLDDIAGPLTPPSAAQVRADVARGRRALRRRRAGQALAGAALAAVAGVTAVALGTSGSTPARPIAGPASPGNAQSLPHVTRLVAYHGAQPPGYTLDK